jgi:hypothetical protein
MCKRSLSGCETRSYGALGFPRRFVDGVWQPMSVVEEPCHSILDQIVISQPAGVTEQRTMNMLFSNRNSEIIPVQSPPSNDILFLARNFPRGAKDLWSIYACLANAHS